MRPWITRLGNLLERRPRLPSGDVPVVGTPVARERILLELNDVAVEGIPRAANEYFTNPTVFRTAKGLRVIARYIANGRREIISIPLGEDLRIGDATATSLSFALRQSDPGIQWFADPRHFGFRGKNYVSFNTGHSAIPNDIYVVEIDDDALPIGPARRVRKLDGRQPVEKNWGFFESGGELYAVYSFAPFRILRCELLQDGVTCSVAYEHQWFARDYQQIFGALHGAASPIEIAGEMFALAQSHYPETRDRVYHATAMTFDSEPPFRPRRFARIPIIELSPDEEALQPHVKLNRKVRSCVYPSGFVHDKSADEVVVSYGINDFKSGLRRYAYGALASELAPIASVEQKLESVSGRGQAAAGPAVRTFYWTGPVARASTASAFGNVGDRLQELLVTRLFGAAVSHREEGGNRLLGIGSIAHRAQAGDVLWGTGTKDRPLVLSESERSTVDVRAVRGPRTLEYLRHERVPVSESIPFFDAGLLIAHLFADLLADLRRRVTVKPEILFVAHYNDYREFRWRYGRRARVVTTTQSFVDFCADLLSAEVVVSSALHGIIFAEALGIPAVWHRSFSGEPVSKYEDYYEGTGRFGVRATRGFRKSVTASPPALPAIEAARWLESLPTLAELRERRIATDSGLKRG